MERKTSEPASLGVVESAEAPHSAVPDAHRIGSPEVGPCLPGPIANMVFREAVDEDEPLASHGHADVLAEVLPRRDTVDRDALRHPMEEKRAQGDLELMDLLRGWCPGACAL